MPKSAISKSPLAPEKARETEAALKKIVDDPLKIAGDPEFEAFTQRQFQNVYSTDPVARDETGKMLLARAKSSRIDPFKPSVTRDDLDLSGPVKTAATGSGLNPAASQAEKSSAKAKRSAKTNQTNEPANVLKVQKALSNTGDFTFDMRKETSGRPSQGLDAAVRGFQKRQGLKVDGLLNPDGPTVQALIATLFNEDGTPKQEARSAERATGKQQEARSAERATGTQNTQASSQERIRDSRARRDAQEAKLEALQSGATPDDTDGSTSGDEERRGGTFDPNEMRPGQGDPARVTSVNDPGGHAAGEDDEADGDEATEDQTGPAEEQSTNIRPGASAITIPPERMAEIEAEARVQTADAVARMYHDDRRDLTDALVELHAAQRSGDADRIAAAAGTIAELVAARRPDANDGLFGRYHDPATTAARIVETAGESGDVHARVLNLIAGQFGFDGVSERSADLEHAEHVRIAHGRLQNDVRGSIGLSELGLDEVPDINRAVAVRALAGRLDDVAEMSEADFDAYLAQARGHIRPEEFEQFEVVARAVRSGGLFWIRGRRIIERDYAPRTARDEALDIILDSVPLVGEGREIERIYDALSHYFDAEEARDEEIADEMAGELLVLLGTAPLAVLLRRAPGLARAVRNQAGRVVDGPEARQAIRRFLRRPPARAFRDDRPTMGRVITAIYRRRRYWLGRMADNFLAIDARIIGTPGTVVPVVDGRLARNMLRELGINRRVRWTGYQAHHIIPRELQNHPALIRAGYDMDHPVNGVFLRTNSRTGAQFRTSTHSTQHPTYSAEIRRQLDGLNLSAPPEELAREIRDIRERARRGLLREVPIMEENSSFRPGLWRYWMRHGRTPN